jgi:PAS domain S-box-containing protein
MTSVRTVPKAQFSMLDYSEFFHSLPGAYIVFAANDPEFTIIEENDAHAQMAMVDRDYVIGKPLLEAFPDTSDEYVRAGQSRLLQSIRKVIQTGKADSMPDLKYDLKDRDGHLVQKYWRVTHHPILRDGSVAAVYQATEDITNRRQTEQKLRLTEYQLTQALSNGAIGTWIWDLDAGIVSGDSNLAELFGQDSDKVKAGLSLDDFVASIHPQDRDRVGRKIAETIESREMFEDEYRTIDGNGDVRWVIARGRVEVDEGGSPISFPGVVVDITERRNAQYNLEFLTKASTLFSASLGYEKTLTNIASMVVPDIADWCTIDVLDKSTGVLEQVVVMHKDPEKIKWAKELRAKQGPPDPNGPTGAAKVLRTGEPEFYPTISTEMLATSARNKEELKLMRSLNFSSVIVVPMKLNDRILGVLSLIATESRVHYKQTDLELAKALANRAALAVYNAELFQAAQQEIKERKKFQRELATANIALEKRVFKRTKQLESTNKGLEEEIIKRQKVEDELQEYSKNLARSNQELQDFAYVASHDLQEPLRKIQAFGDLLESEFGKELGEGSEYLGRMRNAASRMSVLIEDLLAFSRVTTKAHPYVKVNLNNILRDVVSDLESRIEKTKGTVEVQSLPVVWADPTHMRQLFQNLVGNALKFNRPGVPPVVKVSAQPTSSSDEDHVIFVEDNGIGFEEKYLDRIFSVFQRLHGRDTYEGTGIGLAVCRKIAERYGGTITATSKKGKASTFIFKIPIENREMRDDNS